MGRRRVEVFYLFGGDRYYPGGGAADFLARASTVSALELEARLLEAVSHNDWYHITDDQMRIRLSVDLFQKAPEPDAPWPWKTAD